MKISFFIGSLGRGGAERVISILANHYAYMGWDVEIVVLLNDEVGYDLDNKVKIISLVEKTGSYIKRLPKWLKNIRTYVKNSKPDRIVSFIGRINVLVLNACRGLNIPILVSERNDPKHDGRGNFMLWICNRSYRLASSVVYQTKYEMSCFSKKLESKSYIIPNPVNVKEHWVNGNELNIVTAGRLLPQKNQAMLIDAIFQLKDKYPNLKLNIYGDGLLKPVLINKIHELGLNNTVFLCGNVKNLHKRISSATMFVMTSEYEGLSNALIEAMMMGIPCISTNYPGADEIINNNVNGILVPCGDVNKLSEVIDKLLCEKDLCKQLSANGLQTAEAYKQSIVLGLWDNVII